MFRTATEICHINTVKTLGTINKISFQKYINFTARPRPTALLSPSSHGKPEAATAVVVAPDDGHEDARNMLCCI
jgi:hypothetical protein